MFYFPCSCAFQLEEHVMARGNVEAWLGELLMQQQKALHGVIREASNVINDSSFELLSFLANYPAQVPNALLTELNFGLKNSCKFPMLYLSGRIGRV